MAKNKADACIFCEQAPCICNAKPARKKATAARAPRPVEVAPAAPLAPRRASHTDAMRAAAAAAPPRPTAPTEPVKRQPVTQLTEEEIIWNAAIRNLAPLMRESDREKYAGIITSKPHPDEAKIMWKARRRSDAES